MNKIFIIAIICLLLACQDEKNYCGIVIEKGYEMPTSGYKNSRDAKYFVILKVDSAQTAIRINVTVPAWYGLVVNERACFRLSEMDLEVYGNGSDHLIK